MAMAWLFVTNEKLFSFLNLCKKNNHDLISGQVQYSNGGIVSAC